MRIAAAQSTKGAGEDFLFCYAVDTDGLLQSAHQNKNMLRERKINKYKTQRKEANMVEFFKKVLARLAGKGQLFK